VRILVQRVAHARVTVDDTVSGQIGHGIVALVGVHRDDGEADVAFCADKCAHLRIFPDDEGRFNRSLLDVGGQLLAVSQFTLYGDCRRGRRPSFSAAADPGAAASLFEAFADRLKEEHGVDVACGVFGAHMVVELANDGPVTVLVESPGEG
jgi:D-tyrosyl-tRNA(Tyr) deacylase